MRLFGAALLFVFFSLLGVLAGEREKKRLIQCEAFLELFEYIKNAIRYPKKCREARIEGRTSVIFVVTSKGKVKDVKVRKSSGNKKLDKEALRVIRKMPRLTPAILEGKNVSVMLTVPVAFRLDEDW